ncbi:MAG TPA: hypothetical protein VGN16_13280 [Acidobacteriaceae bacterium]|jgi:hypothetical protein
MPRSWFALFLLAAVTVPVHADKPRKAPPADPAGKYPFHDAHANEKVTIAAEPCDVQEVRPKTRLDYFHHGFMPIRVIVTNDSDQAITLDDARILFVPEDNRVLNAATDDDLQRRLFSRKSAAGTKIPLPAPFPSITIHHPPVDKQILADEDDFGFKSTTVAAHTTAAGYLYYDTRNVDDPVLEKATLEIRKVRFASTNKALDTFEIELKPAAAPKPAEKH